MNDKHKINNINETYTVFLMEEQKNDLYDITNYNDEDLYEMLDLNNPTDRELEAKILLTIDKYEEIEGKQANEIKDFFEKVYDHFFDNDETYENDKKIKEGMNGMDEKTAKDKELSDYNAVYGGGEVANKSDADQKLVQTTTLNYGASKLNPLLKETQKRVLQLDSQFRNYQNYPSSTNYLINLSERLHNVVSLRLHSVSIPYTWYNVSNVYNANYFRLVGNVDGIKDVYDLKFDISAGAYNTEQLVNAVNNSIASVAAANTDIDFGTTALSHDVETSKTTLTLDIQQVYNETNFYLYFNRLTSAFESDASRCKSIPGFLGYGNLVIPKYRSSNFAQSQTTSSVENAYSLESIYSNFESCFNATGKTCPPDNITYNSFNPKTTFYLVINDASNGIVGNNYFDIVNFDGPNPYSTNGDSSSNVLEQFRVSFGDVSGLYPREALLQIINRSLLTNEFLSSNASLNQYDISYAIADGSYNTLQRFQLRTLFNRETTKKKRNAKQIILFPDEDDVVNNMDQNERKTFWQGPIWTGEQSCFLFDKNTIFTQPNAVRAEVPPVTTLYDVSTNPTITLVCTKDNFDNSFNNRQITVQTSSNAGYTDGYSLNNLIGVYSYGTTYERSEINTKFNNIKDMTGSDISNGFVDAKAFYDIGNRKCRMQFDLLTYFNELDYTFNVENSFLHYSTDMSSLTILDASYAYRAGENVALNYDGSVNDVALTSNSTAASINIPKNTIKSTGGTSYSNTPQNLIIGNFEWDFQNGFTVNNNNNRIVVNPKSGTGVQDVSAYTIYFRNGTYRTPEIFTNMVNNTFARVQGETDASGTSLDGLRMVNSKMDFSGNQWNLTLEIDNRLTQKDYKVVFDDSGNTYTNDWMDESGNIRYTLDTSTNGQIIESTTINAFNGTMWNVYLGFEKSEYDLATDVSANTEIVGQRDVYYDVSKVAHIYDTNIVEYDTTGDNQTILQFKNNVFTFSPQTNVKGLIDASGVKKVEVVIPSGLYPSYYLYNEINSQFNNSIEQTNFSVIYSFFDEEGLETTVMQTNLNKVYTAQDYVLEFYNAEEASTQNIKNVTTDSFAAITYDVTLGWLLGFRADPIVNLNSTDASNSSYIADYTYSIDTNTDIITLLGDTPLDLYLYKNLYLILNDFTQNHLNDGLVTGVRNNPQASKPTYSSKATKVCNPINERNQSSIFNAVQPGMGLTENQLFAANVIEEDNFARQTTKVYSDPPFVKDMFALIPIKVSSLSQGQVFTEFGGMLQDNRRDYFGSVNIEKMQIQLLNDHGDVIDLNGTNWSFSLIFEYLYNLKGI